jgi:mRNA interferase MazF
MKLTNGDIVLVPFPFTNLKSIKLRPALVIYSNEKNEDIILLAISSQKSGIKEVMIYNGELSDGELPIISYIKFNKVATLHKSLIKKVVAKINRNIYKETIIAFKELF